MEDGASESGLVLVPFLSLVGLSVNFGISALFALYPFNYDRPITRNALRLLIFANLSVGSAAALVLSVYLIWGSPGYHVSSDPRDYIWMILAVIGAHTLLLQAPGAVISNVIGQGSRTALASLSDAVGNSIYGEDKDQALAALRSTVAEHETLLKDYGLLELALYFSDPSLDYQLQEVGGHLLRRLESVRSSAAVLRSPFAELNFIFSVTGASALAALALAVAST